MAVDKAEMYQKMCADIDAATHVDLNFDTVKRAFLYGGQLPCTFYYISGFGNNEIIERLLF